MVLPEILFRLKIEICAVKVCAGCIKGKHLVNLMIINFNDLFILRADIFQTEIELVKRKRKGLKEPWDYLLKSFGF